MNLPNITYNPFSGYTAPVFPAYNDQTHLLTPSTASRFSYKLLTDVYINDNRVTTLKSYPLNGILEVNPQSITSNYLLHDFNPTASPASDNPDSIKKVDLFYGEEYSRVISFSSITDASSFSYFNLTMPTNLQTGDRVVVSMGNQTTYGYAGYGSGDNVLTDIPYSAFSSSGSGLIVEASEYYDYDTNGFHTSNPHNFSVGDTVILQMDSWATGVIEITGGTTGQITQVSVGGVNLLASPAVFTTDLAGTLGQLNYEITLGANSGGYTSYWNSGSHVLHIYSNRYKGALADGLPIVITSTGNLAFNYTPAMYRTKGLDSTGEGWNPQLSGTYTVSNVPTSTTFKVAESIPEYYSTQTGAERGTWYSLNNYLFPSVLTGDTYYVMNNKNFYDYSDYKAEVATHYFNYTQGRFLTNKPRNKFSYFSTSDIETVDLLYYTTLSATGFNQRIIIDTYTGSSHSSYSVDLTYLTSGYTSSDIWKRLTFGVGAWNLNNIPSSHIISGQTASPMINDNVTSYNVRLQGSVFVLFDHSETLTFNRRCTGNDFKYYQLIFLNKWGAFDYYMLNANYEQSLSIERTQFDRKRESVFSPYSYGTNIGDRGKTDFYINSTMNLKLYSDWLTLDEANWLLEVQESPQVYLYCPQDYTTGIDFTNLYPVNVVDTESKTFNDRSRMRQVEINVMVSNKRINQKN